MARSQMSTTVNFPVSTKQAAIYLSTQTGRRVTPSLILGAVERNEIHPVNGTRAEGNQRRHYQFDMNDLTRWVRTPSFKRGVKQSVRRYEYLNALKAKKTVKGKNNMAVKKVVDGTMAAHTAVASGLAQTGGDPLQQIVVLLEQQNRLLKKLVKQSK